MLISNYGLMVAGADLFLKIIKQMDDIRFKTRGLYKIQIKVCTFLYLFKDYWTDAKNKG